MKKILSITFSILFIVSCGGGGGGGGSTPTTPTPTVNLSAEPTSVLLESTSTLTWSSTNATSCSATWTTQTGSSGSEAVSITTAGNNSFSISCTGDGGIKSASVTVEGYRNTDGVVVDGYISGAEVCIDEDDSWTCDASENSTTSDNEGKFTIRYANGNLVSIGGTDLDSQTLLDNLLITHKLTGHSDFKAVTPVTSIAAFMEDTSLVNVALGIDASIDVFTFDPVANKGDGGINDYLYEKGNQLTVLAYALQNITNDLNTTTETTQDYFRAITEEIEKEYTETETKVDIETEAFVTKALDNVIAVKTVTITDEAKANTTKALSGVMPVIEVKSSDDLTTSVIRFAVSTLQTDIQAIANGTASDETVASYSNNVLTYIAEDQNIEADEITPDISAIADSATTSEDTSVTINVVVNDSYLTSAPISVSAGNGSNGTTTLAESSPEQIVYTPNTDYNGTDTFSYTITQGDKTSSADVSVTIEAVNDAPSIDTASTIQAAENQTAVTTISVSDVDEDDLTLTLSGTDANSFDLSTDNILSFKEAPDFETKSSYSITLSLTDSTETVTKDVIIAITNVNDVAPQFTSEATFSAAENQTAIGTVTATDAEGDAVTFTVSGSELAITSAGVLTFVSAPDYETKTRYTAMVTASDGVNEINQDIIINITNVNDPPVFTSPAIFSANENQTAIGTVIATDADGDELVYSISGSEINISSKGLLSFRSPPDYESKASYSETVLVSDGFSDVNQNITINIIDIPENPPIFGSTTYSVDERQKSIGIINISDPDGDALVLNISGQDADSFILNSSFRTISFANIPIYEEKNQYKTTISATDGDFIVSKELVVNILEIPKEDISHPQAIVGTSGNDTLIGERQYDILVGLDGDDSLDGGENRSYVGGYYVDIYQFSDNSGKDTIFGFFIAESYSNDGRLVHDYIEVTKNVNDTNISSASDILDNSYEENGSAVLNLGQGNTITIDGIPLNQIKSEHIIITSPYSSLVQGTSDNDKILGLLDKNTRLEGSSNPHGRFEDGSDLLIGSSGNDIFIGGTNDSSVGGFLVDRYKILDNSGEDVLVGFYDPLFEDQNTNEYRSDKLLLPYNINNSNINSFSDLSSLASINDDKSVVLNFGGGNLLTFHNTKNGEIQSDNIIFTYDDYETINGTSGDDLIYGTNQNDWILGSESFMGRFEDGYDYLFSGEGNDILEGGENSSSTGDVSVPNNYFINGKGLKTIIGFSSITNPNFNPYTKQSIDRVFIEKNSSLASFSDLSFFVDEDDFINFSIDNNTNVLLHGIRSQEIIVENFIIHDSLDNFIIGTKNNDTLQGTSGNDLVDGYMEQVIGSLCVGHGSGHDVLIGGEGNDILIGGPSSHYCGGFNRDTFIFSDNSGIDQILDFTANWELPGYVDNGKHKDILQIERSINGTSISFAMDIINMSSNNSNGFAEIALGGSNKVTLIGKALEDITLNQIRIVPKNLNIISGDDENNILTGTESNDYLKGSTYPVKRFEDGFDILDGGSGDDALDGGDYDSAFGGTIIDIYKFDKNYDNDIIFGFYASDIVNEGTQSIPGIRSDKIEIPIDIAISATTLIDNALNNIDGFAVLNFEGTTVTLHGIDKQDLKKDYFFIVPRVTNIINGTSENDLLIGTDGNDKINGSTDPFGRFEDGNDILEGGLGDDILNGGEAKSSVGGYVFDRYRFNQSFGNDFLSSFVSDPSGTSSSDNGNNAAVDSDRLEINNAMSSSASEIINNATENEDGWAVVNIGDNSITLFGINKDDLDPYMFHIIPTIDNYIDGTQGYDDLTGTAANDYISGGESPFARFGDGDDFIDGGEGDDVLVGGTNKKATGGYYDDTYLFNNNSGNDLIIGFMPNGSGYTTQYNDVIKLPYNINGSGISSFDDVLTATTDNADGWAVIDLGDNNSITLHGVPKEKLLARNFNITGVPEANDPVFSDLTLSQTSFDASNGPFELVATYRVTDESGIIDPGARCQIQSGSQSLIFSNELAQRISGDDKDGIYECKFTITTSAVPGTYYFTSASATDIWGNGSVFIDTEQPITITN